MILQFILKSGATFKVDCTDFSCSGDSCGSMCSYTLKGIAMNNEAGLVKPSFLDLKEVAAVLRLTE